MKCHVCKIIIHLVEVDGKGDWQYQMKYHDNRLADQVLSSITEVLDTTKVCVPVLHR